MRVSMRGLRWALAFSLAAHLVFLLLGQELGLSWGDDPPAETVLEATLLPPPPPPPALVRRKPAAPKPAAVPSPASPSAPTTPTPPVAEAQPAEAPAAEAPATAGPVVPLRSLPEKGSTRFVVTKGESAFPVGRAIHSWQLEGDRYTLQSTIETTGIVSLFANVRLSQTSRGQLVANGLRPEEFRDERKGGRYRADFDWANGSILLGNGSTQPLSAGAQDLLSMFYQFALYPLDTPEVAMMVTTGSKFERYVFAVSADVPLTAGDKQVMTYHLRYRGPDGEGVEVWLARDRDRLPVKIRYVDRKGGLTELLAEEIANQGKE